MKSAMLMPLALLLAAPAVRAATDAASPLEKVLELLADQKAKITEEGVEAKRLYEEATHWCVERSEQLKFEIKTGEATVKDLTATVEQEAALIASLSTKVEQLGATISTQESDLKAATEVQRREAADFAASEKELLEAIDTLTRAVSILEREARKGASSMLQVESATNLAQAFSLMVDASMLTSADANQLTALVQSTQGSEDSDLDFGTGAPAAAAYASKSGSIINTIKDLADKAESQLEDARKKATESRHNFELLKQSLEDHIRLANKEMDEAKQAIAKSGEKKGAAEGDLSATSKGLAEDKDALEMLHQDCMTKAQDYEAETKSREDELKAIGEATKILSETTGAAASSTYDLAQVSFLQVTAESAGLRAVHAIRRLARKDKSKALALLANRVSSALNLASGGDAFAKVKGLIKSMIEKLESEATADASHKAFCDKELAETNAKHENKKNKAEKLATQIDQLSARSAQLKEEVASLQSALAALTASQAEMDKLRQEEKALFVKSKADLDQGLAGVKHALKVLREFYGSGDAASGGAGSGIIGLLEVVESDFSKGLAETVAAEEKAQSSYDQGSKQNQVEKAAKEQDVAYKTKEAASLDKTVADASSDSATLKEELDAVEEYLAKLNEQCVAKAEPFEAKAARRQAEIAGLREALTLLQDDGASLLQKSARRTLRGIRRHA